MPMSLFKNNKNRNKVVNPYCSLGWLLIITIFQKCAKLKPPWVHLGKQINYYVQINGQWLNNSFVLHVTCNRETIFSETCLDMAEIKIEIVIYWLNIVKISVPGYWSNMESFLVYLFNFYYAISELEQNKQNNTIIFFLLFIFLTKKWTSAVCGGCCGRTHRTPPPYGPGVSEKLKQ